MAPALRNLREPHLVANDFGYDEELARWLAESGRRRAVAMKDVEIDLRPFDDGSA